MNKLTIIDGLDEMILTYQGMKYILELKEYDLDDHWFTRKNPRGEIGRASCRERV